MRPNQPNRTPFDNSLVDDPNAPRHTQPLPSSPQRQQPPRSQPIGPQPPGPQPVGSQPVAGRPRPLPPQVVTGAAHDDNDDDLYSRQPRQRQGLPTATVLGVAMMIGALAVILVSSMVSRVVPRPPTAPLHPQNAPAPGLVAPKKKVVAEAPAQPGAPAQSEAPAQPETPARVQTSSGTEVANEPRATGGIAPDRADDGGELSNEGEPSEGEPSNEGEPSSRDDEGEMVVVDVEAQPDTEERLAAGEGESRRTRERARERESDEPDRGGGEERSREVESSRDEQTRSGHFVNKRSGYAIRPPAGFTLQKSGRRTTWRGPGGAQLLVETASVGERSPRADWERMDRGFRKKYGSRYRSHGIYETTLAGRPAAAWEFEIGNTRKIDIAVHHRGTGYAVLGSAPTARFEQVRPQIEAAIRSFRLPANGEDRRSRERRDDDSDIRGY